MPSFRITISAVIATAAALAAAYLLRPAGEHLETVQSTHANSEAPAMCPWREPLRDMKSFFQGATGYRTETIALSRRRLQIIRRLGPDVPMESTALYVNRIVKHGQDI